MAISRLAKLAQLDRVASRGQGKGMTWSICSEHARDTDGNADREEVLFTTTSSHSSGVPGSSTRASQEFAEGKSHRYLVSSLRLIIELWKSAPHPMHDSILYTGMDAQNPR